VSQLAVFLVAAIQTILVSLTDGDTIAHALTLRRLESWRMFQHRGQHFISSTNEREIHVFSPYTSGCERSNHPQT
jgi:hypothetical protein